MTMITRISKADYQKAEKAAYALLQINNVDALPINLKKISKIFPNLKIKTYSWFAKTRKMSLEEVKDFANSNEGCCYYKKSTKSYLILYNDTIENKGRIRWTIAHELGHFILKHNEITDKTIMSRNSLTKKEYDTFESEANCFARNLLAPSPVLFNFNKISFQEVASLCELSYEASFNVIKFLNTGAQMGIRYNNIQSKVAMLFSGFIYKVINKKYCNSCQFEFVAKEAKCCPICAGTRISHTYYNFGGEGFMKYYGYAVDEMGRAYECPTCGNDQVHFEGEHCIICKTVLINKCADTFYDDPFHPVKSCHNTLPGNARYCYKCGNESTFLQQRLLSDWKTEKEEIQRQREMEEALPF